MLAPGDSAPDFTLRWLDGTDWRLAEAAAEGPLLLTFIETDCPTCRLTLPYLKRLAEALGADSHRVVLVSQDGAEETRELVENYGVTFPVLLDADLDVSRSYDPPAVPALFLMSDGGRIELSEVGFHKEGLNSVAARMLSSLGLPLRTVAELDDGAPLMKPGCSSRHLESAVIGGPAGLDVAAPIESSPEPIDLLPERAPRATRLTLAVDEDPYEYCMSAGFSPFLPVVPPTVERVDAFLAAVPHPPDRVVALVPPCYGAATIEKIAANAVMAGCKPEYMEVLLPVVRAACDERFNLHGVQATTNSATPLIILSGPAAKRLGFASGAGVFGNVARANSSVGRALQLMMANLGGALPGEIDMAALGNPGRFSYCVAENHEHSPWQPLHEELGFGRDESTVTLFAAGGLMEVSEHTARTGAGVLRTIAATLSMVWSWRTCGRVEAVLVLCPEHAATLSSDGFSKSDVRDFLFEHTGVPLRAFEHEGTEGSQARGLYEEVLIDGEPHYRKFQDPSQIRIIVAGGTAGKFSGVLAGWLAGPEGSQSVTYPLKW
ncbi:MAG: TlpA family protein disulfide reductase [Gemmatimonadetes bacterium]|nr:TlpA family protein disulfide reductase [Gemmatimonadota bacterium]